MGFRISDAEDNKEQTSIQEAFDKYFVQTIFRNIILIFLRMFENNVKKMLTFSI